MTRRGKHSPLCLERWVLFHILRMIKFMPVLITKFLITSPHRGLLLPFVSKPHKKGELYKASCFGRRPFLRVGVGRGRNGKHAQVWGIAWGTDF